MMFCLGVPHGDERLNVRTGLPDEFPNSAQYARRHVQKRGDIFVADLLNEIVVFP